MKTINMIEINQPIGSFYIGKIKAEELISISFTKRREQNEGIQRSLSGNRANEIMNYCSDPDATFPTPIILSVNSEDLIIKNSESITGIYEFSYSKKEKFAEILDGQHRIEGIRLFYNKNEKAPFDLELPIVVMFDLTEEEKAYVFSTINSNQKSVDKSLIYDLFELSSGRSPLKTCHELARILNSIPNSPFYNRLKMLGKKALDKESLSQGTFVTHLCYQLISKEPKKDMIDLKKGIILENDDNYPLRKYFIKEKDEIILKIIHNYFSAVKHVFIKEWENPDKYILSKTTGYSALIMALKDIYIMGVENKTLKEDFFITQFQKFQLYLRNEQMELTSTCFASNAYEQKKLARLIVQTIVYS